MFNCIFKATRRNPSLPVKLLGYRQLLEQDGCQSNSESLPDLKWSGTVPRGRHGKPPTAKPRPSFGHSVSDPSLARRSSGQKGKSSAPLQRAQVEKENKDEGSTSDCSDQSGWVSGSSAGSSRQNSPPPPAGVNGRGENPYPDIEQAPLAPPEEFQVSKRHL